MSAARNYAVNNRSMSPESRNKSYAAINISWQNMRPDLRGESKEIIREEMLGWICGFLGLKKLDSIKDLSDGQIGKLLDEMKRISGQTSAKPTTTDSPFGKKPAQAATSGADVIHLASEEQQYTAAKLFDFLGWNVERKEEFLRDRFKCPNVAMLRFNKANSLLMILLNTAAHADLKSKGQKTGRAETAKHIRFIKEQIKNRRLIMNSEQCLHWS